MLTDIIVQELNTALLQRHVEREPVNVNSSLNEIRKVNQIPENAPPMAAKIHLGIESLSFSFDYVFVY